MEKIAVFGSAFNPPTLGHKSVIESLTHFDRILLVPSIAHAWGKEMLDYALRCRLIDAFIADLSLPQVQLADVEKGLLQPGQSVTTYALLTFLQEQWPEAELTFVIGPDNLFQFGQFYRAQDILQRWSVMACPEKVKVRSTEVRRSLQEKKEISTLTTSSVETLLKQLNCYCQ
ncbi:nicotinate-nicotinamide nucleotide adenylyltransferase [Vibrio cincinnatiensis]|uniref:nicotinate-nicotinamide nucleotide adenylyltransferase n=1 Tax=Vibrio cincinnatiensis TaxID=675 RepID=UPI001EE12BFC|nr:nicotinate-nicotinamide nucleotide adenylyltransferase [Vibrio cincinnatiensis]MCG3728612.1 nicotinate-nicotinamide nucleotide adenylyltransferase [Vibrio cincinnatiensis]